MSWREHPLCRSGEAWPERFWGPEAFDAGAWAEMVGAIDAAQEPAPALDVLVDRKRARERLEVILDSMDKMHRTVFVLHELEGLSAREIAERAGVPPGTVASRLRRGREIFRQHIKSMQ